jgi:cobalamin biosynthesis Mg chelatase CobN
MILSDPLEYTSSGCTFAGAPTPTTATCSYTQTLRLGTYSTSRTNTYNVPDSTVAREIYSATLAIAGSTSLASTATKTATEASVTHASTTGSSSDAASSDTEATGAATNIATTTTASGNGAYKTSVPMMLMGGLIAGVALNL